MPDLTLLQDITWEISNNDTGVFHGKEAALLLMLLSKKHTEYTV